MKILIRIISALAVSYLIISTYALPINIHAQDSFNGPKVHTETIQVLSPDGNEVYDEEILVADENYSGTPDIGKEFSDSNIVEGQAVRYYDDPSFPDHYPLANAEIASHRHHRHNNRRRHHHRHDFHRDRSSLKEFGFQPYLNAGFPSSPIYPQAFPRDQNMANVVETDGPRIHQNFSSNLQNPLARLPAFPAAGIPPNKQIARMATAPVAVVSSAASSA